MNLIDRCTHVQNFIKICAAVYEQLNVLKKIVHLCPAHMDQFFMADKKKWKEKLVCVH